MPRRMSKIKYFSDSQIPYKERNLFVDNSNQYIDIINSTNNTSEKKQALIKLEQLIKEFDDTYPASYFAKSEDYQSIHNTLFKELKIQWNELGKKSLLKETSKKTPLTELIANMSSEKANQLTGILIKGKESDLNQLKNLYKSDDTSDEANEYRNFLSKHEIKYLGGGNSKNFKVTNLEDTSSFVLKIEYRFDLPKKIETHLYNTMGKSFSSIEAERQVICKDENKTVSRTLVVTEYHEHGSLRDIRKNITDNEILKKLSIGYLEEMGGLYEDLQDQSVFFTDSKASNFLVNSDNKLCIADTKSFIKVNKEGDFISGELNDNKYIRTIVHTSGFTPPEFNNNKVRKKNNEHGHAFMYGANMYHFITGKNLVKNENQITDGKSLDFSHEVFQSEEGKRIQKLIENLVQPNPQKRMSVRQAHNEFFMLKHPAFEKVLKDMELLKNGSNDKAIDTFIKKKQKEVNNASDDNIKQDLLKEFENKVRDVKFSQDLSNLKKLKFGPEDKKALDFVKGKLIEINEESDPDKKQNLLQEANDMFWNSKFEPVFNQLEQLMNSSTSEAIDKFVMETRQKLKESPDNDTKQKVFTEAKNKLEFEQVFIDLKQLQKDSNLVDVNNSIDSLPKQFNDTKDKEKIIEQAKKTLWDLRFDLVVGGLKQLKSDSNEANIEKFINEKNNKIIGTSDNKKQEVLQNIKKEVQKYQIDLRLQQAVSKLHDLKFGPDDMQMLAFIKKNQEEINNALPVDKEKLLLKLEETVNTLKDDKPLEYIKNMIQTYRKNAGLFTIGMNRKANRLEQAMRHISVEDRCKFNENPDTMQGILKALASHRFSGKTVMKEGNVDEKHAATAFKTFKERYKKEGLQKKVDVVEQQQDTLPDTPNKKF